MSDKNMFDSAIMAIVRETMKNNENKVIEAYTQGKPIMVNSDGTVEVIENYLKTLDPTDV